MFDNSAILSILKPKTAAMSALTTDL